MTNERILVPCVYQLVCCFFARPACDRGSSGDRVSRVLSSARAPQSLLLLPRRSARASAHECARHEGSDVDPLILACRGSRVAQASSAVAGIVGGHACGFARAGVCNRAVLVQRFRYTRCPTTAFSRFSSARLQPSADERMAPVRAKRRISGREQPSRLNSIGEQKHTNRVRN